MAACGYCLRAKRFWRSLCYYCSLFLGTPVRLDGRLMDHGKKALFIGCDVRRLETKKLTLDEFEGYWVTDEGTRINPAASGGHQGCIMLSAVPSKEEDCCIVWEPSKIDLKQQFEGKVVVLPSDWTVPAPALQKLVLCSFAIYTSQSRSDGDYFEVTPFQGGYHTFGLMERSQRTMMPSVLWIIGILMRYNSFALEESSGLGPAIFGMFAVMGDGLDGTLAPFLHKCPSAIHRSMMSSKQNFIATELRRMRQWAKAWIVPVGHACRMHTAWPNPGCEHALPAPRIVRQPFECQSRMFQSQSSSWSWIAWTRLVPRN